MKSGSAATVLEVTGFEAGGVGPCGFLVPFHACFVEERCFCQTELWCGAGVKRGMLKISPADLLRVTSGQRVDLAEGYNCDTVACEGVSKTSDLAGAKVLNPDQSTRPELSPATAKTVPSNAGASSTAEVAENTQSVPWLAEQLAGVGDGSLRWFPERAFDFYPSSSRINGGEDYTGASQRASFTVVVEQDPGHVGGIVWDAETVLSHRLVERYGDSSDNRNPAHGADPGPADATESSESKAPAGSRRSMHGLKVVELGAGTGLAGCVCGRLGAETVVLTELKEALPLLQRNARRMLRDNSTIGGDNILADDESRWQRVTSPVWSSTNATEGHERDAYFAVEALSWGEDLAEGSACATGAPFDVILVADCVYLPELYTALTRTIRQLAGPGTEVLICFEQRRRDISGFFDFFSDGQESIPSEGELECSCAAGSEHLPGSDGRRPLGKPSKIDSESAAHAAVQESLPMPLLKPRLEWEQSPLLASARNLAKVHFARVVFN